MARGNGGLVAGRTRQAGSRTRPSSMPGPRQDRNSLVCDGPWGPEAGDHKADRRSRRALVRLSGRRVLDVHPTGYDV